MSKEDKNLISLKEAAKISGYSADYVGQLIRSGKIPGKQVYCNIAWMTTAEAVLDYKNNSSVKNTGKKSFKDIINDKKRKIGMEMNIIKLFFQTFKSSIPLVIIVILSFLILNFSFIYYLNKNTNIQKENNNKQVAPKDIFY